jgi:hypothetical protein
MAAPIPVATPTRQESNLRLQLGSIGRNNCILAHFLDLATSARCGSFFSGPGVARFLGLALPNAIVFLDHKFADRRRNPRSSTMV